MSERSQVLGSFVDISSAAMYAAEPKPPFHCIVARDIYSLMDTPIVFPNEWGFSSARWGEP